MDLAPAPSRPHTTRRSTTLPSFSSLRSQKCSKEVIHHFPVFLPVIFLAHAAEADLDTHVFSNYFCKLYSKLFKLDRNKYLPPKFSYSLKDLAEHFGVFREYSPAADKSRLPNEDSVEEVPAQLSNHKKGANS